MVLERTLESPLNFEEIQPVHPKGDQSWVFIGRTDVEAETLVLWPPGAKSQLTGKDSNAEIEGATGDEIVEWHHRLNGHKFEQTPVDKEGQGSLACCHSWGSKQSDTTE